MRLQPRLVLVLLTSCMAAQGGEIGFVEEFALAPDRTGPLQALVPGTEDYYYFHCLHHLQREQFDRVDDLLAKWVQRHGETSRVWQIRTRQALLAYDRNPDKSLDYLRRRLGLYYPHQQQLLDAEPNLPTSINSELLTRDAFMQRARPQARDHLEGYEDRALFWLATTELSPLERRSLLTRLKRPDVPKLVKLVADDLKFANSGGFGSLEIHRALLRDQLDALVKLQPELLNQHAYVVAYLTKLQPSADSDWATNPQTREAYLDQLWTFAQRLSPVHNSLKAHVLYHRLAHDRRVGKLDKARFLEYVKLPRRVPYAAERFQQSEPFQRFGADLGQTYDGATLLPAVGSDEPLVRAYLAALLLDAPDAKEYEPYINDQYLQHLFAEVKIVNGLGEPEQWASLLPPAQFQQLKERVDLDFDPTSPLAYSSDEPVRLTLFVKNVRTLLVKVFEINAAGFYQQNLKEIDSDINLDGLVANSEQTHAYDASPFLRQRVQFDFPMLQGPGTYVVDFIGNGRSSRALVRKGRLQHVVRTTAAGQQFTIFDDQQRLVNDARLWVGGREYNASKDGRITVPFSTSPERQTIVLSRGKLASLGSYQQESEDYALHAGLYVDRESLLSRRQASLLIRPSLTLQGTPVSLKLLEEPKLTIIATDLDGVPTTQEVPGVELFDDRESIHEFLVPQRLARLEFKLSGKVARVTRSGEKTELSVNHIQTLNGIHRTDKIEGFHLMRIGSGYVLELRGKTGEPRAARPVTLSVKHRDFRNVPQFVVKTDPAGRISLGALPGIAVLTATGPDGNTHTFTLSGDEHSFPASMHAAAGDVITLPYLPSVSHPEIAETLVDEVSLLEVHGNTFVSDQIQHVTVKDGLLTIKGLIPGDYDLRLKKREHSIRLRVSSGTVGDRFLIGKVRQLERRQLPPLQIADMAMVGDGDAAKLRIRLSNVTKFARVHVMATRYVPEYAPFPQLGRVGFPEPYEFRQSPVPSLYLTGRNIGDEYRYIIDRRYATKFPGNTLERPQLLLNPWAVRSTATTIQTAEAGESFAPAAPPSDSAAERMVAAVHSPTPERINFSDLDYLAEGTAVLTNLVPNADGVIEIPREALGDHQQIHVIAVDPQNTTVRSLALPEAKGTLLDLRLANGLDFRRHFTQQRKVSVLPGQQNFVLKDVSSSRFEVYDSLARVYQLYVTLTHDPKLMEFSFLMNWPELNVEEKRRLYSLHASHELNVFLSHKDPEFFRDVVQPYLKNKKDKTFVDRWLLSDDLQPELQPWRYGQLNTVERILMADRIETERPRVRRFVSDQFALLPPNTDQLQQLFEAAVQNRSLSLVDEFGTIEKQLSLDRSTLGDLQKPLSEMSASGLKAGGAAGAPAAKSSPMEIERKKSESRRELARGVMARDGKADAMNRYGALGADKDVRLRQKAQNFFYDADGAELAKRAEQEQLFRVLDPTMEWAENNYHHLTIDLQNSSLITTNAFWRDFAMRDPNQPFQSANFAAASRNFSEMLLALAVLDLPFQSPKHETTYNDLQLTLRTGGTAIIVHEEVLPADAKALGQPGGVLVSQNFFRHGDRRRVVDGEEVDKFVTDEFLVQTVYGTQIVITNPTSSRQKLSVLIQIPQGSIPVLEGQATRTVHLSLEPYHTQTLEQHFYFPFPGEFPQFPVHVARNEALIAAAEPVTHQVVLKPTKADTASWDYVSQLGTADEVLAFLDRENVQSIPLERIAWRMHDAAMFRQVIDRLTQRHAYHHTLWSYALKHNDVSAAREFLQHADSIVSECGGRLASTLLTIDPILRHAFEHLEYKPLVNARAHALGKRRQIVNDRFYEQYQHYLEQLCFERSLGDADLLAVTYYLLLQDRIEEALATFARVRRDRVSTQMQYDYCAAYLGFYTGELTKARGLANTYAKYPVDRWQKAFAAIIAQLDEVEGQAVQTVDGADRTQQQTGLAAKSPTFQVKVEAGKVHLDYQHLASVQMNFYEMDVELLFSRNPFSQQFQGQFTSIRPNQSLVVELPADQRTHEVALPAAFQAKNVLVEVVAAGQSKAQPYYANSLDVQTIENYGQIKVASRENGRPLAKAYVKVYSRTAGGAVKFYKDGYTDVRGRFDYASLSTNDLDQAERFSILVLSDDHGAVVREAAPPLR